jgi:hypothetical protein
MQIENELHKIDISITKALINNIGFTMREDDAGVPHISVGLSLMSVGGHKVTDVMLGTDAWQEGSKLRQEDIPIEVYNHLAHIVKLLVPICTRKINSIDKLLS